MSDTETAFRAFTQKWLDKLKRLEPIPTGHPVNTGSLAGVGAVIFDIYGTLLISASGDVDVTEVSAAASREALSELNLAPGAEDGVADILRQTIHAHHAQSTFPNPEVDIVAVWAEIMSKLRAAGLANPGAGADPRRVALAFELANNPVHPMPNAETVLELLGRKGYPLGIVSNAQFFTPLALAHFLPDWPFADDLTVYSFQHMRAKPDPFLFERLADGLSRRGLAPADALYVGNDMLNDVATARTAGFKTVLFAGDQRSLRLRTDRDNLRGVEPDRTIDDLAQLLTIVGDA